MSLHYAAHLPKFSNSSVCMYSSLREIWFAGRQGSRNIGTTQVQTKHDRKVKSRRFENNVTKIQHSFILRCKRLVPSEHQLAYLILQNTIHSWLHRWTLRWLAEWAKSFHLRYSRGLDCYLWPTVAWMAPMKILCYRHNAGLWTVWDVSQRCGTVPDSIRLSWDAVRPCGSVRNR